MKQMDNLLFQQAQSIDEIKNRLNCIETGSSDVSSVNHLDHIKSDPDFITGVVDNIMENSNLSEIIEQIDVVQTENRELRDLLHAQQKTINEMNIMLLKLFSQVHNLVHEDPAVKKSSGAIESDAVKPSESAHEAEAAQAEAAQAEATEAGAAEAEAAEADAAEADAAEADAAEEASIVNVELEVTEK
jgi:hypothetical protein